MAKTNYPTAEEIEHCRFRPSKGELGVAKEWKKFCKHMINKKESDERKSAIKNLCSNLLRTKRYHYIDVQFVKNIPSSCFLAGENKIWLKDTSIITALHETAHALYGPDELRACSWSTKMFQELFPEEYKELHWEGHMLKK